MGKKFPRIKNVYRSRHSVKVEELNRGIIIQSGNDACVAMAEHIAGSEDAFTYMNAWADTIGMKDTHFANVHGLDNPNLYSTPYDMALLGSALIRDVPDEYRIPTYKFKITQYNRNGLLWDKSMNVDGIKTVHTSNAGYSLVSSATEMRLVAVEMGTKTQILANRKVKNYSVMDLDSLKLSLLTKQARLLLKKRFGWVTKILLLWA